MGAGASLPKVQNTILIKTILDKPYEGEQISYDFKVNTIPVKLSCRAEGHQRHVANAESMEELYKAIGEKYLNNYRLAMLHHIPPPTERVAERPDTEVFQVILLQNSQAAVDDTKYTISVEHVDVFGKLSIGDTGFQDSEFEVKSNTDHLLQLIQEKSAIGARLVTVALTGSSLYHGFHFSFDNSKPVIQMDFVFDIPSIHNTDLYSYHMEPVNVTHRMIESKFGKTVTLECDWVSHFEQQLKKGWRLIDIFADGSSKSRPSKQGTEVLRTYLWVFEKPFSEEIEVVQRYEAAVIEQSVSGTSSVVNGRSYWEDEISKMGREGWELACIIQNPSINKTLFKLNFGNIVFFQRRLQ